MQEQATAWEDIIAAKKEAVGLQLEGEYRSRLAAAHAAVKKRLLNNPRPTVNELREKVPGLSGVSRERVQWAILHKIGLPARVAKKKPLDEINCSFQFVDFVISIV